MGSSTGLGVSSNVDVEQMEVPAFAGLAWSEEGQGDVGEALRALRRQHLQNMQASITPVATPAPQEKRKKKKTVVRSSSVPPKSASKKRDAEALRNEALHKEAVAVARGVMRTADTNKNKELSFTELTCMLESSAYQDFGRWVKEGKQRGFSKYDHDSDGTINLNELTECVVDYMSKKKHRTAAMAMVQKATAPARAFVATSRPKSSHDRGPL